MNINAAIIGTGIGIKHLEAIEDYKKGSVKIICEKNKNRIKFLKKKFKDIVITTQEEKIFKDKSINLVSIASYDNYHFNHIIKCLKNDKHIIVEKPMCLNMKHLRIIENLVKKKPRIKIISNLVLRVNSLFLKFKENLKQKDIFYIEADYLWGRKSKLFQWRSKIGDYTITLGAAIHMIDLVMWLLQSNPINVSTFGNDISTKNTKFKNKSFVVYILEFPKDIIVKITANAGCVYNHFHEVKIFQKNKTIVNSYLGSYLFKKSSKKTIFKKLISNYPDKENRKKLIQNFINSLKNSDVKPIITFKEQLNLMKVCFAADKSLKLKKKNKN